VPGVTQPSNLQQAIQHIANLQNGTADRQAGVDDRVIASVGESN
jgi:hypothetical protein